MFLFLRASMTYWYLYIESQTQYRNGYRNKNCSYYLLLSINHLKLTLKLILSIWYCCPVVDFLKILLIIFINNNIYECQRERVTKCIIDRISRDRRRMLFTIGCTFEKLSVLLNDDFPDICSC